MEFFVSNRFFSSMAAWTSQKFEWGLASAAELKISHHGIPDWVGLEGTLKTILSHGQGQLPLSQVAPACPWTLPATQGQPVPGPPHIPNRILRVWCVGGWGFPGRTPPAVAASDAELLLLLLRGFFPQGCGLRSLGTTWLPLCGALGSSAFPRPGSLLG